MRVYPLVLGPHNVPVVTSAADLPLAALSAITHAGSRQIGAVLEALATAIHEVDDEEDVHIFAELTELGILGNAQATKKWSELMAVDLSFFRSPTSQRLRAEGRAAGEAQGRAAGEAQGRAAGEAQGRAAGEAQGRAAGRVEDGVEKILRLLSKRGVSVPAEDEQRIRSCGDIKVLDQWFDRAITATEIAEVFAA